MGAHLEERLKALLPFSGREDVAVAKEEEHFIPQRLEPLNWGGWTGATATVEE